MKKTLKSLLIAIIIVPCVFVLTACGGINGKYTFSHFELDGEVVSVTELVESLGEIDGMEEFAEFFVLMLNGMFATMEIEIKDKTMTTTVLTSTETINFKKEGDKLIPLCDAGDECEDEDCPVHGEDAIGTITVKGKNLTFEAPGGDELLPEGKTLQIVFKKK